MADDVAPFYYGNTKRAVLNNVFSDNFAFGMFLLTGAGGVIALALGIWFVLAFSPLFAWLFLLPGIGVTYFTVANIVWKLGQTPEGSLGYDSTMKQYQKLPENVQKSLRPIAKDYMDESFTGNDKDFQKLVREHHSLLNVESSERNRELISELYEGLQLKKEDVERSEQAKQEAEAIRENARKQIQEINRSVIESVKAKK